MTNDQIRLSILYQYYRAMFNGERASLKENPVLKDIPDTVINANLIWLIDKGLINGEKRYSDDGRAWAIPIDISANGMDIIEKILNQSLPKLDQNISSEIKKETTSDKRFDKLYEISSKVEPVFNILINVAGIIFSNLR